MTGVVVARDCDDLGSRDVLADVLALLPFGTEQDAAHPVHETFEGDSRPHEIAEGLRLVGIEVSEEGQRHARSAAREHDFPGGAR